jgi:THO complex subunit 6
VESGKIKMTFKGHSDYLHTVVSRSSASQILTGSEDGTARIWGNMLPTIFLYAVISSIRSYVVIELLKSFESSCWYLRSNAPQFCWLLLTTL